MCFRVIYIDNVLTFVNDLEVICPGKKVKMSISIIDPYTTQFTLFVWTKVLHYNHLTIKRSENRKIVRTI